MYLDTCMAVKLYLPEAESDRLQKIVAGTGVLSCSEILISEFGSTLARKYRERQLNRDLQNRVWNMFSAHLAAGYWNLIPLTRQDLFEARRLIWQCQDNAPLRTLDAIHLAICRSYKVYPLCTMDRVMLQAAHFLNIPVRQID